MGYDLTKRIKKKFHEKDSVKYINLHLRCLICTEFQISFSKPQTSGRSENRKSSRIINGGRKNRDDDGQFQSSSQIGYPRLRLVE